MSTPLHRFNHILAFLRGQLWRYAVLLLVSGYASGSTMIDLTQPNEYRQWRATNDNVMGGISEGNLSFTEQQTRFQGHISLENNGGFSSVSRRIQPLPDKIKQVQIEYIGDGRLYQLRVATWVDNKRITYKHDFKTLAGEKTQKTFKLEDFQAVFRGKRIIGARPLMAEDIQQVGLLIADKKAGPFSLLVNSIHFQETKTKNEQN